MDLTKKNSFDPINEIDSHSELGLNLTEFSPLDLHDSAGFFGTALYDYFSSQLYVNGNNINSDGYFDLINGYNATLMNPNVATPVPSLVSIPSDYSTSIIEESKSTDAYQLEYSGNEHYLEDEPASPVDLAFDGVSNASSQQTRLSNFENNAEADIATHQEIAYEAAVDDEKVYPKPSCSFTYLIALAFKNSRTGELTASEIYSFMCEHFPYYRTASKSWKSSVRHNLSFSSIFKKIEATSTVNNTTKRKNLWTIDPTKVDTLDSRLQKLSRKYSLNVKQAMLHPEHLELLERGEMKFDTGDESSRDELVDTHDEKLECTSECNEYQLVPIAKRRKKVTGVPQADYVYEVVVTRRKTPLSYLTTEAGMEPSFENDRAIDFSTHGF